MNIISRSTSLASQLKATSRVVSSSLKPATTGVLPSDPKVEGQSNVTSYFSGPIGNLSAVSGVGVTTQVRCAHTDFQPAEHGSYRKNPNPSRKTDRDNNYGFHYLITGGALALSAYTAKSTVVTLVEYMAASKAVLAMAKIEIKMNEIPEGKSVTFSWNGKPLFVRHRTADEIKIEQSVNVGELRDPQHDSDRTKDPAWLVVIGVCTHLGCVPIANSGDFGGYYCPCHGSHYDAAGRIRKGPAPLNLEVPPHEFKADLLIVG